ncbi:endonuclease NucS domain-containing protein [Tamlana crocina]
MAKHYAIVKNKLNEVIQSPLKNWVRQNLDQLTSDFDPDNQTTSQIRSRLIKLNWNLRNSNGDVFLIRPDENNNIQFAEEVIAEIQDEDIENIENEDNNDLTFSLEKDLQSALRLNIETIEFGLKIVDGGNERNTKAGRIDITAQDQNGRKVIIELKAIEARPSVIAQTLAYMEAVSEEDNCEVRGIIIASGFSERVLLASRQIKNLKLIEYKFQFNFSERN